MSALRTTLVSYNVSYIQQGTPPLLPETDIIMVNLGDRPSIRIRNLPRPVLLLELGNGVRGSSWFIFRLSRVSYRWWLIPFFTEATSWCKKGGWLGVFDVHSVGEHNNSPGVVWCGKNDEPLDYRAEPGICNSNKTHDPPVSMSLQVGISLSVNFTNGYRIFRP